jgi:hypothetical protein
MNHNRDILDRLHHAQPPRPYIRLIDDSIIEIERLRSLINAWADAEDEADMIRGVDLFIAYQALRKAVGR